MTPEQEIELQKRILALEEERDRLKKAQGEGATKAEIASALADVNKTIAELKSELAEVKKVRRSPGADRNDPDLEDESPTFM